MEVEFIKASELLANPRSAMSVIFVEGWHNVLKIFCTDKTKLRSAFEHIFRLEDFYVALIEAEVVAFVAVSKGANGRNVVQFDRKELRRYLGFIRGNLAHLMLTKEIINRKFPFEILLDTAVVEFVATSPTARGKGLSGRLIEYAMERQNAQAYILEVVDSNSSAIKVYERLGFVEFSREKSKHPEKYSGFEYYIYMKREFPRK